MCVTMGHYDMPTHTMTPGIVVSLRVNPTDVMAIIDALDYIGIPKANLSFAQATKLVLASALEGFRQAGIVPRRDGFEYLEMIAPFEQQGFGSRGAKLKMAKINRQPNMQPPPIVVPDTPEVARRRVRFDELIFKYKADPNNFADDDMQELLPLMKEFQQVKRPE